MIQPRRPSYLSAVAVRHWHQYDTCPTCGVGPGQPCVDLRVRYLSLDQRNRRPHRGRRRKELDE